ncbi:MAG: DUF4919 domain-containing protein [Bacteroidetes bacterium]|nr:DUF4919 domain-containing protein [Bacteroidota bacterium]
MNKIVILSLLTSTTFIMTFGQTNTEIVIPTFRDRYCEYVRDLEAGKTDIDYQDFRFNFLESEQFKVAGEKSGDLKNLEDEMYRQLKNSDYQGLIHTAKQMLSIDYTSMIAHKMLQGAYKSIGDTANSTKYKTIEFGLLNSIVKKGDGRTCKSGWPVIQVAEEYFILRMIGAKVEKQSIDNEGGLCDKMVVNIKGEQMTYYFETSKVFLGYKKLGL